MSTDEDNVAEDDDVLDANESDDNDDEAFSPEDAEYEDVEEWTVDDDVAARRKVVLFAFLGIAVIFVGWLLWHNKKKVKSAAEPVIDNLQTGATEAASQAQDVLGDVWDKASEKTAHVARSIAASEPAQTVASAVGDAPSTIADTLELISKKLREQAEQFTK